MRFSATSAAAVTCASMKPELTPLPAARNGGRPLMFGSTSNAPRRDRGDLGRRERENVGGEGHRLGVEVTAREHLARVGKDEWIVGDGVGFRGEGGRLLADQV